MAINRMRDLFKQIQRQIYQLKVLTLIISLIINFDLQTLRITQTKDSTPMIRMQYPTKKLSRIKNPFSSSEALDSDYSDSRMIYEKSSPQYDEKKFPNVFQYNDRSRVMVSDSDLGSSINDGSGENIFAFSRMNNRQKVQEVASNDQFSNAASKNSTNPQQNRYSFNPSTNFQSPTNKHSSSNEIEASTNVENMKKSSEYLSSHTNTITVSYQAPQVKMFKIEEKPQYSSTYEKDQYASDKCLSNNQQFVKSKQNKKTFKPSIFSQLEDEFPADQKQASDIQQQEFRQENQLEEAKSSKSKESFNSKGVSSTKKPQEGLKQEIQDELIDIFISSRAHKESIFLKDKQKAKILQSDKLNLSAGSEVHSYTDNILENLRDQMDYPNEQIQLNFQSRRNSEGFRKQIKAAKNIVESRLCQQQMKMSPDKPTLTASKKPRKKIFEVKTDKSTYNREHQRSSQHPYVSQFDRNATARERHPSPSQILMKSLNIIDKMASQKSKHQQKSKYQQPQSRHTESIVVIPPAPLTINQSPSNYINVFSPSPEQVGLQKQILEISFQISSIQTTFDMETFDRKNQVHKIQWLNDASIKLFEKYKNLIMSHRLIDSQNSYHCSLKKQIMLIREATTKLLNFQQKYIQTKQILSTFEEEIKDILLLSSKQKYKKIKLLNEAIEVMEKTETYLSLEIGKIPVLLKTFVGREKLLLQELRDWLKQCITKQNSI